MTVRIWKRNISVLIYIVHLLCFCVNNICKGVINIIVVDLRNPKPIYEQIRDNIKHLIVTGALKQDEKLPSIRELSLTTSINPNTIQKAFRELETEGYVYTVPGRGSFVAPPPKNNPDRINELFQTIKSAADELIFLGTAQEKITEFIRETCFKEDIKHD